MAQKSLHQIRFAQPGNRNGLALGQHNLPGAAPADIVEIYQIAPVTFEEAPGRAALKIFQLLVEIGELTVFLMKIEFSSLHFTVYNLGHRNDFTRGSALDYNIFCRPLLQQRERPIHRLLEAGLV